MTSKKNANIVMREHFSGALNGTDNPSDEAFQLFAELTGMLDSEVKQIYKDMYREETGNEDDPLVSMVVVQE